MPDGEGLHISFCGFSGYVMNRQTPSILVVDDDLDTCQNLQDILADMGYVVETAQSGESALELVRGKSFDIALLDLKMPGMDGLTLYREIRKVSAGTVAMIVTAYATPETAQEAISAGTWRLLSKPVNLSVLLPSIEEAANQPLVLVVDDDKDLCENLWDLLREHGYRVSMATDETEAATALEGQNYQVVLIDMKLPHGDGRSVLKRVRDLTPEAKSILITGYRDELSQRVEDALEEGADGVCYKPFDIPQLLETLHRLSHSHE